LRQVSQGTAQPAASDYDKGRFHVFGVDPL
jgi:hypothetical protein